MKLLLKLWNSDIEENDLSIQIIAPRAKRPEIVNFIKSHLPSLPHTLCFVGPTSWKATWLNTAKLKEVEDLVGRSWLINEIKFHLVSFKKTTYE